MRRRNARQVDDRDRPDADTQEAKEEKSLLTILFLHPALDADYYAAVVPVSKAVFDKHPPQVVVGSPRVVAVAMNINSDKTKLVPA